MSIRHTLIAALAAAAFVPSASWAEQPPDMHASTALAATKQRALAEPPDMHATTAMAAGESPSPLPPTSRRPLPTSPTKVSAPAREPVTDDGSRVPVIPIVAAGLGMLIVGLTAHYGLRRASHRRQIAA